MALNESGHLAIENNMVIQCRNSLKLSSQQKEQAQKCFELLSTNLRISTSESGTWIITMSAMGGFVLLTPITSHIQTALTKPSAP